jgi:phage terminase large subunit-like protein
MVAATVEQVRIRARAREREFLALAPLRWENTRRPSQTPPDGDWSVWLIMAGRGFGKTRSATEWVRQEVMAGRAARVQLVSSTAGDVRDVIVEGRSGIITTNRRSAASPSRTGPSPRRLAPTSRIACVARNSIWRSGMSSLPGAIPKR